MVKVTYFRKKHRLCVSGHAGSGDVGHDLVCASASILTYTLANFVATMSASGTVRSKCIKLESGDARVSVNVEPAHDAALTLVFDAVCSGFDLLASDYPDFVKYEILEY